MKNTLIVVADLGAFRAYRIDNDGLASNPRLETVVEFDTIQGHTEPGNPITIIERRSSKARSNPRFAGTASDGEQHNFELEKRSRLIKQLAETLERLLTSEQFEACFFAAPPDIHRQMLAELPPAARSKIQKNLRLDLAKVPKNELLDRFAMRDRFEGREKTTAQPASAARKGSIERRYRNSQLIPAGTVPLRLDRKPAENIPARHSGGARRKPGTRRRSGPGERKSIASVAGAATGATPLGRRRRGEPAPLGGFEGKQAAHWSAYRENLSTVKRKPEARHAPAVKKALRRARANT